MIQITRNKREVSLFLDSGAFSAFTQGIEIDIYAYIDFIKRNKDIIEVYANLDVIGDAKATWKNQLIMEDAGLAPLPVYHYSEPEKYLIRYLERGHDYIALGGLVMKNRTGMGRFFDHIFSNFICDEKGMPKVKVHGFGMTILKYMLKYPFYSVDSTSWVLTGRMGVILIPRKTREGLDYSTVPHKVTVSNVSPAQKKQGAHFSTSSPVQQKIFREYFMDKGFRLGYSEFHQEDPDTYELKKKERWNKKKEGTVEKVIVNGLSNDYRLRDKLNIMYFLDLEDSMPEWPWAFKLKKKMKGFGVCEFI